MIARRRAVRAAVSLASAVIIFAAASIQARAQLTVINLHPAGASGSAAFDATGTQQQVGYADVSGQRHASLWSGTAASWVDLNPFYVTGESVAEATTGSQQVGYVSI